MAHNYRSLITAVFAATILFSATLADADERSVVARFHKELVPLSDPPVWAGTGHIGGTQVSVIATLFGATPLPNGSLQITDFTFEIVEPGITLTLAGIVNTMTGQIRLEGTDTGGRRAVLTARTRDGTLTVDGVVRFKP